MKWLDLGLPCHSLLTFTHDTYFFPEFPVSALRNVCSEINGRIGICAPKCYHCQWSMISQKSTEPTWACQIENSQDVNYLHFQAKTEDDCEKAWRLLGRLGAESHSLKSIHVLFDFHFLKPEQLWPQATLKRILIDCTNSFSLEIMVQERYQIAWNDSQTLQSCYLKRLIQDEFTDSYISTIGVDFVSP